MFYRSHRIIGAGMKFPVRHLLRHFLGWAGVLAFCAGVISRYVPFQPVMPAITDKALDDSWRYAIAVAAEYRLAFGHDLVFTYGPYGSIATGQYAPAGWWRVVAGSLLVGLATALGLVDLYRAQRSRLVWLAPAILALVGSYDALLLFLPVLTIAFVADRVDGKGGGRIVWDLPVLGVLTAGLFLLPLIKGSLLVLSVLTLMLCVTMLVGAGLRGAAWVQLCVAEAAFAGSWVLAGQSLSGLPEYLSAQIQIVGGYSEAMAVSGPPAQIVVFLLGAAIAFGLFGSHVFRQRRVGGWGLAGGLVLTLFLAFKEGFVRHDFVHVAHAIEFLGLACWMMTCFLPWRRAAGCAAVGILVCGLVGQDSVPTGWGVLVRSVGGLAAQLRGAASLWPSDGHLEMLYGQAQAAIRRQQPLPVLQGTTDIYSWDQAALLAAGMAWDPRPVLQSYSAYTPGLARLDVEHLTGRHAPDNVLFCVQPIDDRLPSLEDGTSWPPLLTRYEWAGGQAGFAPEKQIAWLRRREKAGYYSLGTPVVDRVAWTGAGVDVPDGATALWASIDVAPTLAGRAATLAFKPPPLWITVRLAGGATERFRFMAGPGKAGFLLSPLVHDTGEFVALMPKAGMPQVGMPKVGMPQVGMPKAGADPGSRRVVSFQLSGGSGTRLFWGASYRVRLWPIEFLDAGS